MIKLVPVLVGGSTIQASVDSISNWKSHHGTTAAGVQVNSLKTAQVGDSTVIASDTDVMSVPTADLEIAARDTLKTLGYDVVQPKTGH